MTDLDFLKRYQTVDAIPADFTPHTDDSSSTGYPPDVTDDVRVDVVMRTTTGALVLWTDQHPQTLGWSITAHYGWPDCPILAYHIRS